MADEDDADESTVFEITDFTTASEWERFISKIEEILHKFKLDNNQKKASFVQRVCNISSPSNKQSNQTKLQPLPIKSTKREDDSWEVKTEALHFSDFCFELSYHIRITSDGTEGKHNTEGLEEGLPPAISHMFDMTYDFPPRAHCLSRWFGLKEFLVLSPAVEGSSITSESRCHLLLSSVSVALANTKCCVPLLVQLHDKWRRLYLGICLGNGFRTTFEMAHLRNIPKQFNHLKGLLDIFKDKLLLRGANSTPVTITVRFTYFLNEWSDSVWPQQPPDIDSCFDGEVGLTDVSTLPFGTVRDAVSELHLSTTWPCLSEDVIVDNGIYSDLDPLQAPQWHVRVRMTENPKCLLGEYLDQYMKLCHRKESTSKLIQNDAYNNEDEENQKDYSEAFQKLLKPKLPVISTNFTTVVNKATTKITGIGEDESPIPPELLKAILKYLFPDAEKDVDTVMTDQSEILNEKKANNITNTNDRFRGLKGSPKDSLTYALATCICIVNQSYGGLRAVSHLWQEFVLEMRYRWDKAFFIPRLAIESPNLDCCLIHQKLQMLNCCISRKFLSKKRAVVRQSPESKGEVEDMAERSRPNSTADSSDEEFFEALEDPDDSEDDVPEYTGRLSDADVQIREGALKRFGDRRLLVTGEPLYIPVTQETTPMTEDMLQEHADILTQLGTSEEGTRIRAQMQSASLMSDMEAFKAANPGCLLEDFVRWYSPNDWLQGEESEEEIAFREQQLSQKENDDDNEGWSMEDEEVTEEELKAVDCQANTAEQKKETWCEQGRLSLRMRISGNIWQEVWMTAKPRPVRRQRRLFDETKEAEKVFHYLSGLRPGEVATQLLPVILQCCVRRIEDAAGEKIVHVNEKVENIVKRANQNFETVREQLIVYQDLFQDIRRIELTVARAQSLSFKLSSSEATKTHIDDEAFISSLLDKPEVHVVGASRGPMGHVIKDLFTKQETIRAQENDYDNHELQVISRLAIYKKSKPRISHAFPSPAGREFILRTTAKRPGKNSRHCPQRMYCVLAGDEFRLAAAFTSDTTFT